MNNKGLLVLIAILVLACSFLGYKVYQGNNTIDQKDATILETNAEREKIELELEKMMFSYDTLSTENSFLMAEMAAQRSQIEDLMSKVKNKDWSIAKLKKETGTLRDIMKGYIVTIDSLNQLNDSLRFAADQLTTEIQDVRTRNDQLTSNMENMEDMIATGQILQASGMLTNAIKLSSSGKQNETTRAKKADMIKSCFTLMDNKIAQPGKRMLYMKIIAPNGQPLPSKDGNTKLDFEDGQDYYSVKREVDYNNAKMDVCVFYEVQGELEKGDYTIFVYEGTNKIGTSSIALK